MRWESSTPREAMVDDYRLIAEAGSGICEALDRHGIVAERKSVVETVYVLPTDRIEVVWKVADFALTV